MYKPDGTVIHITRDEAGPIQVAEHQGVRSLHFGSSPKQSSMCLADPLRLELSYIRAMLCGLLFEPSFRKALIIGLGGGSLAKFLLHYFPRCRLVAVEQRERVVQVAHDYFGLPRDPRFEVIVGDGGEYVRQAAKGRGGEYDFIFVDAFDHGGMAFSTQGVAFTDACAKLLAESGILSVNLWGSDRVLFEQSLYDLGLSFDDEVLQLPVPGRGNTIGLGFAGGAGGATLRGLKARAHEMQARYDVEFPAFLRDLRRHNGAGAERFFA